jgi:hypothetical protein
MKVEFETLKSQHTWIPDMFKQLSDQIESLNISVQQHANELKIAKRLISDGLNDKEEIHKSQMVEIESNKESVNELRDLVKCAKSQRDSSIIDIRTKLEEDSCQVKHLLSAIEKEILSFECDRRTSQSELSAIKEFVKESTENYTELHQIIHRGVTNRTPITKVASESSLNNSLHDIMLR